MKTLLSEENAKRLKKPKKLQEYQQKMTSRKEYRRKKKLIAPSKPNDRDKQSCIQSPSQERLSGLRPKDLSGNAQLQVEGALQRSLPRSNFSKISKIEKLKSLLLSTK